MIMNTLKLVPMAGIGLAVTAALMGSTCPLFAQGRPDERGRAPEARREQEVKRAPEPQRRVEAQRPALVERDYHGSIHHDEILRREPGQFGRHVDIDVGRDVAVPFLGGLVAGAVISSLPSGYETYDVGGRPYYYYDGTYFNPGPGGYVVVNPPQGVALPAPPPNSVPITVGEQTYYYLNGAFYVQQGAGYANVQAPAGVIVPQLPVGAVQVITNGAVSYSYNGVYYRPVFQNGVTMYMTGINP
jgi:hypothetical protein